MGSVENVEERIKESARKFYEEKGQTHGIEHLERSIEIAEFLAEEEDADKEIVRLGAILHQLHDAEEARSLLEDSGLDEEILERVVDCVKFSDIEKVTEAESIESKVVYDADKLQVVGPFGLVREIACESGERGIIFREALENSRSIEEKCFETLQTDTGQRIGRRHHEIMKEFWEKFDEMDNVDLSDKHES